MNPTPPSGPAAAGRPTGGVLGSWRGAAVAVLTSVVVAWALTLIDARGGFSPDRALKVKYLLLAAVTALPCAVALVRDRLGADPWRLALAAATGLSVALTGCLLYWAWPQVTFPADVLIWSEGDFLNDVLKFRAGYPLYTAQVNNDSFTYPPGAQLTTYLLASLAGRPLDVPTYRIIQLGYTLGAAVLAVLCARSIARTAAPAGYARSPGGWTTLWLLACVLFATNHLTNPFTFLLHNDALAQLLIVAAYLCLVRYADTGSRRTLALLAVLAAAGFLVKQSLAIWCFLPCIHLAFFDRDASIKRAALFAVGAGAAAAAVVAACRLTWGEPFTFWVLKVLGAREFPLMRVVDHIRDAWAYYAAGLVGGSVLIRGPGGKHLLGPWLVWLALLGTETFTSGIAFMHNHAGPGSLIGGVWFLAALPRLVPLARAGVDAARSYSSWLRAGCAFALLYFLYGQMAVVRRPEPAMPADAWTQAAAIEAEFKDLAAKDVMIDVGAWMHARGGTFTRDLAPSIGERGTSGTGDFSGILERLATRRYARILVRNIDSESFWYDYKSWQKSSGIRAALLANYEVVRTIPAASAGGWYRPFDKIPYAFGAVSVLEPKSPGAVDGIHGR